MAFKKILAQRFFRFSKISNQYLTNCRISSSSGYYPARILQSQAESSIAPDPGDNGSFLKRLLHKPAMFGTPATRSVQRGDSLVEKLKELDLTKDRIRLEGLAPPKLAAEGVPDEARLTARDARKLLRVAQLEMVKSRLRSVEKSWIWHSEFVRICGEGSSDPEEGVRMAKMLDESGTVVVLGNMVLLKPEQENETLFFRQGSLRPSVSTVVKAIGGLIPLPATNPNDPRKKELEALEKQKAAIDEKATNLVRRELWGGLGFLVFQTAAFMRLTFWELSWDVMEPICFYLTSAYFMAGYGFFLRTSKEPSFEGFYQSRFVTKQNKLMKVHNFDVERYNELRKIFDPNFSGRELPSAIPSFDQADKICQSH